MSSDKSARLLKKIFIRGEIEIKTGVSIGGSSVGLEIGGVDKVVVRNPINNQPYIPGSSLKGKMRSLLERLEKGDEINKNVTENIRIHQCPKDQDPCLICKIFGLPAEHPKATSPRVVIRDSELKNPDILEKSKFTDMPYTEVKTEVVIDRISSKATPRNFERVPAGAIFNLEIVLNIYEGDNEREMIDEIFKGLRLVQDDYLGGSGTRGYGKVKINLEEAKIIYKDKEIYESGSSPKLVGNVAIPDELKRTKNE